MAMLPLRIEVGCTDLRSLVLGSPDPQRFTGDMATGF